MADNEGNKNDIFGFLDKRKEREYKEKVNPFSFLDLPKLDPFTILVNEIDERQRREQREQETKGLKEEYFSKKEEYFSKLPLSPLQPKTPFIREEQIDWATPKYQELKYQEGLRLKGLAGRIEKTTITVPVSPNTLNFTRYVVPGLGEYDNESEAIKAVSNAVVSTGRKEGRSVSAGEFPIYEITGSVKKIE